MVRDTVGVLLKWWFVIVLVGALMGGAAMAVSWSTKFGGLVGMSLGAMMEGAGSLVDGWNLTTTGSTEPTD